MTEKYDGWTNSDLTGQITTTIDAIEADRSGAWDQLVEANRRLRQENANLQAHLDKARRDLISNVGEARRDAVLGTCERVFEGLTGEPFTKVPEGRTAIEVTKDRIWEFFRA